MMIRTLLLLIAAATLSAADYFPLEVGNQWIYKAGREVRVTEIRSSESVAGRTYYLYTGLSNGVAKLRYNEAGQLVALQENGAEALWADFSAKTYDAKIESCTGAATVIATDWAIEIGKHWLGGGFAVRYAPAQCADAGVTRDIFIPGVGLVEREVTTFAGPRTYTLTYARVGGMAVLGVGESGFRLALDKVAYPAEFEYQARLTLENTTGQPLVLNFTSGQSFDIAISDAKGNRVHTWSANKLFPAVIRDEVVEGEKNWTASERVKLEPGKYTMEAYLVTAGGKTYSATVPLTVTP